LELALQLMAKTNATAMMMARTARIGIALHVPSSRGILIRSRLGLSESRLKIIGLLRFVLLDCQLEVAAIVL
jgi:hypothetical protein